MTTSIDTVKSLRRALDPSDGAANLRVLADGTALSEGFHVTEISVADIQSLDCGGRRLAWKESTIQVLDSGTGRPMTIATLRTILEKAEATLPGLTNLPLAIDADPNGAGLRRYSVAGVEAGPDGVTVALISRSAVCKPVVEAAQKGLPGCRSVGCCA
ncbi:MAG: DUF6428 family protein [Pseudomonadota bacterium]